MANDNVGWFADVSDEDERDPKYPWQAFIQVAGGCFPLPVWFESERACTAFIEANLVGLGKLDD